MPGWSCSVCTYENASSRTVCEMCQAAKPAINKPTMNRQPSWARDSSSDGKNNAPNLERGASEFGGDIPDFGGDFEGFGAAGDDSGWGIGGGDGMDANGDWDTDGWGTEGAIDDPMVESAPERPYKFLDEAAMAQERDQIIRQQMDFLGLNYENCDLLMRWLRYDRKDIDKYIMDSKFKKNTNINAGLSMKIHPPLTGEATCGSCICDYPVEDGTMIPGCGHFFCNECWTDGLQVAFKDGVQCIFSYCMALDADNDRCTEKIPASIIERYFTPDQMKKYNKWVVTNWIDSTETIKWCPCAGCELAVEYQGGGQQDIHCRCDNSWCFACLEVAHSPAPCDLLQKWNAFQDDEEAASMRLIAQSTKKCPKCKALIEKDRACNHMHCSQCNHDFCWQCGQQFSTTGGDHPSWYDCLVTVKREKEGKLTKAEKKRIQDTKFLQKLTVYQNEYKENETFHNKCTELTALAVTREAFMRTPQEIKWLYLCIEDLKETQRYLMYSTIFEYFLKDSGRKTTFCKFQHIVQQKNSELIDQLAKALASNSAFNTFLDNRQRVDQFRMSVVAIKEKTIKWSEISDEIYTALANEADDKSDTWACSKDPTHINDDNKQKCSQCNACRKHGDWDCLNKRCKEAP